MEVERTMEGIGEQIDGEIIAKKHFEDHHSDDVKENGVSNHSDSSKDSADSGLSASSVKKENDIKGPADSVGVSNLSAINILEKDIKGTETNEEEKTENGKEEKDKNLDEEKLEETDDVKDGEMEVCDDQREVDSQTEHNNLSAINGFEKDTKEDETSDKDKGEDEKESEKEEKEKKQDEKLEETDKVKDEEMDVNDEKRKEEGQIVDNNHAAIKSFEKGANEDETNEKEIGEEKESEKEEKEKKQDEEKSEETDTVKGGETEVSDSKRKVDSQTVDKLSEKNPSSTSVGNEKSAAVKTPVLPQSTSPLLVPVSSVPYVFSQQQMIVHQQQTGYITKVGNQHIFVPVPGSGPLTGAVPVVTSSTHLTTHQQAQPPAKPAPEITPKSSLEMIELMKWEIQNRIPDNYNWSVAFHPKKEELSTVSAFLLELGHDVVKEAVYKDIILIQTKKKDQDLLKESEIESLEKMKTVYENTKKKVEHLEMKMLKCKCKHCRFQTESEVVMNHHKDHPHVDPPWDWTNGYLCCAHCDFRTKQTAAFSFHMEAVHNAVAKMPEKPGLFPCEMCPLDLSTKNKLLKHRVKCMKTFKLNVNLQPYYHDVNFCMKTCYYKPKKPKPVPPPKKPDPRQVVRSAAQLAPGLSQAQMVGIRQNLMQPQLVPRPPPLQRQPVSITPIVRAPPAAFRQSAPQISKTPVVRQLIQQQKQSAAPGTPPKEMSGFEVCELCGGYVKDRQALRIHFYYAHKVEMPQTIFNRPSPPLTCDVCDSKFWTTQGLSKHKSTLRHYSTAANAVTKPTPTSHKCFMCSRNVTNLFIHVEQTHGMTMKDLVAMKKCIMCGITATDKRQLEVHMSSLHGVLIKANDLGPEATVPPPTRKPAPAQIQPKPGPPGIKPSPTSNKGKSMVRNNLCVFCQIQFADNIQLTMHCIKIHATCSACGMVVASSKHLANHHCKKMMRDCDICGLKKLAPDAYAVHIKKHVRPCSVKVDKMTDSAVKSTKEDIKKNYKPAVISLDSDSGESDVEVVDENENPGSSSKSNADLLNSDTSNEKEVKKQSEKVSDNGKSNVTKKESGEMNGKTEDENKTDGNKKEQETGQGMSEKMEENAREKETSEEEKAENDNVVNSVEAESESDNKDVSLQNNSNDFEPKLSADNHSSRDNKTSFNSEVTREADSSQSKQNELTSDETVSDSAKGVELSLTSRKRKNSDDEDLAESKRKKSELDDMAESQDQENISDSESKDAECSNMQASVGEVESDRNTEDSDGAVKRPHNDDSQEGAGDDSGTESDQAYKRRKVIDETEG